MQNKYFERTFYNIWLQLAVCFLIVTAATLLCFFMKNIGFPETNIVVIYILAALLISYFTSGYILGIASSIACLLAFNFFFTAPILTFNVYDNNYLVTFFVMFAASILTSTLTSKIKESSDLASSREAQLEILYNITSSLSKASSMSDVAEIAVQCLSSLFDCEAWYFIDIDNEKFEYHVKSRERFVIINSVSDCYIKQLTTDKFTLSIADDKYSYGTICIPTSKAVSDKQDNTILISSIATQIFVAMERERLGREQEKLKNETEREKFKSNLLRAISHDLRGPLSGISGSAEVLMYSLTQKDDKQNLGFVKGIYDSTQWLTLMVENILNLTKIQEGSLSINKQGEAVEEIISVALRQVSRFTDNHSIKVDIPDEIIIVQMDGKLISQVLINLISNALKYSHEDDEITISVNKENDKVWFGVSDCGVGLSSEDFPRIFDLFFISKNKMADSNNSNGLGLAICKTIVKAHNGEIYAKNNEAKGATFYFYLPL